VARPSRSRTVRCAVEGHRRVDGEIVADILSCGHEFVIRVRRREFHEDRLCRVCTDEKYGPPVARKPHKSRR
jgi:hypothetical protein